MDKVNVAGLKIDSITKVQLLHAVLKRIWAGQKTFITTAYSEFLHHSFQEPKLLDILNKTDFAVADGIGIFWAKKYLDIPLTAKSYWGKILQAFWQIIYSLAAIIFNTRWIKSALPEKIVGADLVWDLAKLAANNNLSVFLLGGFGNTTKIVAEKLSTRYPRLIIHYSNKNPNDPTILDDINRDNPDILFVAYGPIKQESWIARNLPKLSVKLVIGVGGTFDYIAGKRLAPPKFVRKIGLEWLWRLITQPWRLKRIFNATFGLAWGLWHYKVFSSLPLRPNVVVVILNSRNEILVGERNPKDVNIDIISTPETLSTPGYWQIPQGGIDQGENLLIAAYREAKEETGLNDLGFVKISEQTYTYIWNNALRQFWKNRYKKNIGQIQNIVYFKFHGSPEEVKIDYKEFINHKWVALNELEKLIHPERLP